MPNDMMIEALNAQRMGKMDKPMGKTEDKPEEGDLEMRVSEIENTLKELCQFIGYEKKEVPAMPGKTQDTGNPGKSY